jgi:hypothetical protein
MSGAAASGLRERLSGATARAVGSVVLRLILSMVLSGVLTFPLALAWAVNRAEVREQVGITPTTFTLTTGGRSELRLGVAGTVYVPASRGPFGVVATVDGPGDPGVDGGDLASYVTPELLRLYAGLFHEPKTAADAYVDQLLGEFKSELLLATITLATFGGLALFLLAYILPLPRYGRNPASRVRVAATVVLILICTTAVAVVQTRPVPDDGETLSYPLPALTGTMAEGSTTNSLVLRALLGGIVPKVRTLIRRQDDSEREFRALAEEALAAEADKIVGPDDGEIAVLMQSDIHCNTSMIRLQQQVAGLLTQRFGEGVPRLMAIAGDLTTNGTAAEGGCIGDIAGIPGEAPVVAVAGNHESEVSMEQMNDAEMTLLDGSRTEVAGVSLLGDQDPERSELFGETRLRGSLTQTDVGEDLYDVALEDRPDLVLVHEAYAAQAFLDVADMRTFLDERGGTTRVAKEEPVDDGIRDVPAAAVFYGHWHREVEPRVVWNSDGSWTLVMELGTTGGAVATPIIGRFSTPWSRPLQTASFPVVFLDEESRLVTGYQLYRFEPDGSVSVLPRVDIGAQSN